MLPNTESYLTNSKCMVQAKIQPSIFHNNCILNLSGYSIIQSLNICIKRQNIGINSTDYWNYKFQIYSNENNLSWTFNISVIVRLSTLVHHSSISFSELAGFPSWGMPLVGLESSFVIWLKMLVSWKWSLFGNGFY